MLNPKPPVGAGIPALQVGQGSSGDNPWHTPPTQTPPVQLSDWSTVGDTWDPQPAFKVDLSGSDTEPDIPGTADASWTKVGEEKPDQKKPALSVAVPTAKQIAAKITKSRARTPTAEKPQQPSERKCRTCNKVSHWRMMTTIWLDNPEHDKTLGDKKNDELNSPEFNTEFECAGCTAKCKGIPIEKAVLDIGRKTTAKKKLHAEQFKKAIENPKTIFDMAQLSVNSPRFAEVPPSGSTQLGCVRPDPGDTPEEGRSSADMAGTSKRKSKLELRRAAFKHAKLTASQMFEAMKPLMDILALKLIDQKAAAQAADAYLAWEKQGRHGAIQQMAPGHIDPPDRPRPEGQQADLVQES